MLTCSGLPAKALNSTESMACTWTLSVLRRWDYESRLTEMFPGSFKKIRLLALDAYDIALSKLERNVQRDRDDVKYLARTLPMDLKLLAHRYEEELKPILGNPTGRA